MADLVVMVCRVGPGGPWSGEMDEAAEAVAVGLGGVLKRGFKAGVMDAHAVGINADNLNDKAGGGGGSGEAAGGGHGWLAMGPGWTSPSGP